MDVEAIERSTVAGVAPAKVVEVDGWLAPLDSGAIGRAKTAVPLSHAAGPGAISEIEAAYWTEGLSPAFRIADVPGLKAVRDALTTRGYVAAKPTIVTIGDVERLARLRDQPGEIVARPDAAWGEVFVGEGFDVEDGASRVAALSRAPDALYGQVRQDGRTVAVGVVTFAHGWAGIHGMRTDARRRGQGLASQVLAALGRAILERGVENVYLQVEEPNPARSLYRKAGFTDAWRYHYWTR
ncbi:GNAT family N-acetyltransferase [Phenylobacterium sp. J367]|uniref:GNAT family N-acetyltransferase n=1 Tax=Phenylobacterium sp. J367 TaxID=2898435 RepID=UPI002151919D|nr:GNAT family N-acetyltransferase [Phenylobacterium sp. J367]MCR5880630.1 GNAT family N-acetyltransferase [Phenylobacterium sp. J367]